MKEILVGIDGSQVAQHAAQLAAELAKGLDGRVTVMYVHAPYIPPADISPSAWEELNEQARRQGVRLAAESAAQLHQAGVKAEAVVAVGDPAHELAKRAEQPEVAMVLVGRSGKGAVRRLLVGSVASRLSHICPKPLMLVP